MKAAPMKDETHTGRAWFRVSLMKPVELQNQDPERCLEHMVLPAAGTEQNARGPQKSGPSGTVPNGGGWKGTPRHL